MATAAEVPVAGTTEVVQDTQDKLSLPALTAMVVGSMVGAGVSPFRNASRARPASTAQSSPGSSPARHAHARVRVPVPRGPQTQPRQRRLRLRAHRVRGLSRLPLRVRLLGESCAGNAFYWVLITSASSRSRLPAFRRRRHGRRRVSVSSVWGFYFLIMRGVKEAAGINAIVTVAKLVPLAVFVLIAIFVFKPDVFIGNLTGGYDVPGGESCSSRCRARCSSRSSSSWASRARACTRGSRRSGGCRPATVLGFLSVLALFATITIVSYGILPKEEIAELRQPRSAACSRPRSDRGARRSSAPDSSSRCSAPTSPGA